MVARLYSSNIRVESIFQLLKALPNLCSLHLNEDHASVQLPDLALLVEVAQHTLLRDLSFKVQLGVIASGPAVTGPECLNSLRIQWSVHDESGSPGKLLAHLYEFLRPSLATLTCLDITDFDLYPNWKPIDVYVQHLDFANWPICPSISSFRYRTLSRDIKVLALSSKFPNLTHLGMIFEGYYWDEWATWTVCDFQICLITDTDGRSITG